MFLWLQKYYRRNEDGKYEDQKGDMVKVIAGRDKDKEGKVIAVNKKDNTLLVEGVNMVTKHAKPSMANQQGGILHQEGYLLMHLT